MWTVIAFLSVLTAFMAAIYAVIALPLLKRMDDIRADLGQFNTSMETELRGIRTELKTQGERLYRH
jgi:hypothetical protein